MDRFLRAVGQVEVGRGWTCIEAGGGEGICPESQSGICAIVQYYAAHVTKEEERSGGGRRASGAVGRPGRREMRDMKSERKKGRAQGSG